MHAPRPPARRLLVQPSQGVRSQAGPACRYGNGWHLPCVLAQPVPPTRQGGHRQVRRGTLLGDDGERVPVAIKLLLVSTHAEERDM